jgi:hypothetical protein
MARPMPRVAPVTRQTLFAKSWVFIVEGFILERIRRVGVVEADEWGWWLKTPVRELSPNVT